MLFNSVEFAVFLVAVATVHFVLLARASATARKAFLLIASYAFYASYNPPCTLLLAFSTLVDWFVARAMVSARTVPSRRALLLVSLVVNLGMLAVFKYGDFVIENVALVLGTSGQGAPAGLGIFLPVGISFYTFQTLSYTIDVYRGDLRPARNLLDFALYVSFFPQLVAGPIVRAADFLPQLATMRDPGAERLEYGLLRIASGLVKKIVLADTLGAWADVVFGESGSTGGLETLVGVYAYAYQIYFDFSGYSDIAIGLGALFGLRIPENFDRPYLADSPRDFWRRWHISLSTWLRDYLYIPLGGNRAGRGGVARNLMITMLLGGLWHGAAWTYVAWGGYHGLLLVVQRGWEAVRREHWPAMPRLARQVATFHLVVLGWILFRAPSLGAATTVLYMSIGVEI